MGRGYHIPTLLHAVIHRGAWKGNSQKLVRRMVHSPARWPRYGRPETSQLLNVDYYMLHVRTELRSGQYAAPVRTLMRGGVVRRSDPRLLTKGPAVLTSMCVQAISRAVFIEDGPTG